MGYCQEAERAAGLQSCGRQGRLESEVYANGRYHHGDLEELADRARAVVARGYKAFKFDPFGPGGRDMPRQELRQAPLKWRP